MSPIREHYNPIISKLLREHDRLTHDQVEERKRFQRRILFFNDHHQDGRVFRLFYLKD